MDVVENSPVATGTTTMTNEHRGMPYSILQKYNKIRFNKQKTPECIPAFSKVLSPKGLFHQHHRSGLYITIYIQSTVVSTAGKRPSIENGLVLTSTHGRINERSNQRSARIKDF